MSDNETDDTSRGSTFLLKNRPKARRVVDPNHCKKIRYVVIYLEPALPEKYSREVQQLMDFSTVRTTDEFDILGDQLLTKRKYLSVMNSTRNKFRNDVDGAEKSSRGMDFSANEHRSTAVASNLRTIDDEDIEMGTTNFKNEVQNDMLLFKLPEF